MQDNNKPPAFNPMYNRTAYQYLYGHKSQYGYSAAKPIKPKEFEYQPFFVKESEPAEIDQGPQTVEQILYHGYLSVPKMAPETAIFSDKKQTSWLGLDDILTQIKHREQIYYHNMTDLKWSQCYAFNEMAKGGWPATDEKELLYNRRMQDIAAQERLERTAFWRDVSRLRQQIPESVQNYLSVSRKMQILDEPNETEGGDFL